MPIPPPLVTGVSPKEGPPGTRITIRGENLGHDAKDLVGKPVFIELFQFSIVVLLSLVIILECSGKWGGPKIGNFWRMENSREVFW